MLFPIGWPTPGQPPCKLIVLWALDIYPIGLPQRAESTTAGGARSAELGEGLLGLHEPARPRGGGLFGLGGLAVVTASACLLGIGM